MSPDGLPSPAEVEPLNIPAKAHRFWAVPLVVLAGLIVVSVLVTALVPARLVARELNERLDEMQAAPYARVPSSAQPVGDRLTVTTAIPDDGGDVVDVAAGGSSADVPEVFPSDGSINFVTVSEPSQSLLSWWVGRNEPAIEFLTEEDKFGVRTPDQRRVFSLESMRTAEEVAQYVALIYLGFDATILPGDVLISEMVCLAYSTSTNECVRYAPSDDVLDPGDRLLEAEGITLGSVEDLVGVLADHEPGDVIAITVDRRGTGTFTVDVELTSAPDNPDRTIVGFVPFDTRRIDLPFEIDIDTGSIGGPSAGLAFTLTIIDALSEGELTGGRPVAVTGTMQLDGSVGPIGGLRQKASAVSQAGIDLFLVPAAQGDDDIATARVAAPDLEIVPVATLDEAIAALIAAGGDAIER
jgi:PDZ domain-containing protein